jgi:hypothetical protein
VVASWATVVPVAREVRRLPSPPVRAVERAAELAAQRGRTVVADRRLHAFVILAEKTGRLTAPVVFDHVFSFGVEPPPPGDTVMVFDIGHEGRVIYDAAVETFSCDRALLRRLSQDRFLEVRVVDGAVFGDHAHEPLGADRVIDDVVSENRRRSGARKQHPGEDPDGG